MARRTGMMQNRFNAFATLLLASIALAACSQSSGGFESVVVSDFVEQEANE